jgi:hypothetical protein
LIYAKTRIEIITDYSGKFVCFFLFFFVDPFMIYVAEIADKIYWYVLGFFVLEFFVLLVSNVGFFPLWIVLEYI